MSVKKKTKKTWVLGRDFGGLLNDAFCGTPHRRVVPGRAPALRHFRAPSPWRIFPPLAHVEVDVSAWLVESLAHVRIVILRLAHPASIAVIHLDPVYAPLRKCIGIIYPMVLTSRPPANASMCARASVQAKSQVLRVHVTDQVFHPLGEVVELTLQKACGVAFLVGPADGGEYESLIGLYILSCILLYKRGCIRKFTFLTTEVNMFMSSILGLFKLAFLLLPVIKVEMVVAVIWKSEFNKGIGRPFYWCLVAVIKNRVLAYMCNHE